VRRGIHFSKLSRHAKMTFEEAVAWCTERSAYLRVFVEKRHGKCEVTLPCGCSGCASTFPAAVVACKVEEILIHSILLCEA
jgi:hypothetical protein